MPKPATPIILSRDEEQQLRAMRRKPKAQARSVERAQIVLRASEGMASKEIARQLRLGPAMLSKWRTRFEREGLSGLHDDHRAGRPPTLDEGEFRARLLAQLEEPPPAGHARWDGRLLAHGAPGQRGSRLATAANAGDQSQAAAQLGRFHRSAVYREGRRCGGPVPDTAGERRGLKF